MTYGSFRKLGVPYFGVLIKDPTIWGTKCPRPCTPKPTTLNPGVLNKGPYFGNMSQGHLVGSLHGRPARRAAHLPTSEFIRFTV